LLAITFKLDESAGDSPDYKNTASAHTAAEQSMKSTQTHQYMAKPAAPSGDTATIIYLCDTADLRL